MPETVHGVQKSRPGATIRHKGKLVQPVKVHRGITAESRLTAGPEVAVDEML
jgi:hypothetical protein